LFAFQSIAVKVILCCDNLSTTLDIKQVLDMKSGTKTELSLLENSASCEYK